ncbi:MAG: hypothetical protein COX17_05665 [Deltaproteobacteria bacterium CG23_combo_of_CG06-09_8_20_14_all_60_8]|nr:MAG: hypothetical protein COX17_05665 [Deltaproteobacteria bacterium CG23_combo_of_CG06-09_8_20_14_all_60_8]PIY48819.1 MAG: hypothetical protein COZ05_01990 [Armatimonadetes bacterium CG_4_10_14_3_um_filter_59_10]
MHVRKLAILIAALLLSGCPAVCQTFTTRCANDVAQICDAHGHWQQVMNCREIEPGEWDCSEGVHEGEPRSECVRREP